MHVALILLVLLIAAFTMPVSVSAPLAIAVSVATYVSQRTVRFVTGVESSAGEVFKSVGLGVFFYALLTLWQTSFNAHFFKSANIELGAAFFLAYSAGFMIAMRINPLQAGVVAVATTASSVLLFLVLRPLF